jgi:hypothetical protein
MAYGDLAEARSALLDSLGMAYGDLAEARSALLDSLGRQWRLDAAAPVG